MTTADVERLYAAVESLRADMHQSVGALRDDVHGYREELNRRLRTLETSEAERKGAEKTRGSLMRVAFGVGGFAAAVATVLNVILMRL